MEKSDRAQESTLGRLMMHPLPAFWTLLTIGVLVVGCLIVRPQTGRYTLTCDHPASNDVIAGSSYCFRLDTVTGEVQRVRGGKLSAANQ